MRKYCFSFLVLLFTFGAYAQDTIYKRSGEVIIAKISEISPTEIHYKRFEMPDGPKYIENKSAIKEIRFSNGLKEEFAIAPPPAPPMVQVSPLQNPALYNNKIVYFGDRYMYNGIQIKDRELNNMLLQDNNPKINELVKRAKVNRAWEHIGFLGIPLGAVTMGYLLKSAQMAPFYSYTKTTNPYKQPVRNELGLVADDFNIACAFFVGTIACPISSSIFKIKKGNIHKAAIKLYNEKY